MSHTIAHRTKLLSRVRRLKGQMEAIERALETDTPCGEILNLVASVRGAVGGLIAELIEDHITEHLLSASDRASREEAGAELIQVVKTYLK